MRAPRSDNGSLVSSPDAPSDSAATQIVLAFDDNRLASMLFGQYGQNLALIERRLGVVAEQRGNHVNVAGSRDGVELARRVLEGLYEQLKRGDELVSGDVEGARRLIGQKDTFRMLENKVIDEHFRESGKVKGTSLRKSALYVDMIRDLHRINSHIVSAGYPIVEAAGLLRETRLRDESKKGPKR